MKIEQEKKEQYALDMIQSFNGSVEHAINCVDRLIQMSEMSEQKEFNSEIRAIIVNRGEQLKRKVIRVVKKKQLIQEHKVLESWRHFFGDDYHIELSVMKTNSVNGDVDEQSDVIFSKHNPDKKADGLLRLTYKSIKTGVVSHIIESEWYCQINDRVEHLTPYQVENYVRLYDDDLNPITN